MTRVQIKDMTGGLNTAEPTKIKDNQFSILQNMFYNSDFRLQSRKWIKQFWEQISGSPVTSLFSFVNDNTWESYLLATAWTSLYQYNSNTNQYDEVKTWLTEFETDGVTRTRWSFAVYLNKVYMCNGVDDYAEYDPSTTTYSEFATQPKVRHLAFLWDAIYGWWADNLPNTLYFTNAWATDWQSLNSNSLVVWWDESWRINWLEELQTQIQVFKDDKIYSVAWDWSSALPTDSESGWYADRAIKRFWNSLVNLSERWIDTLKARNGVGSTNALESKPLSDNVRDIFAQVKTNNRKFACWEYLLPLTNYYVTIDATNDNLPETTLVYSSLTKWWSQYTFPAINDYSIYVDTDWNERYLVSSANSWVIYEIETGVNDLWSPIPVKLRTKKHDFNEPTLLKTFQYVDIIWFKSIWWEIDCNIYIEWQNISGATIDDSFTQQEMESLTIWTRTIGTNVIWWWIQWEEEVELFPFFVRIPMYETWLNIEIELLSESTNLLWTIEKITLEKDNENVELFEYNNIA